MGIQSVHPDYEKFKKSAEYCETFMEGEWAVKEKGTKLLPALSGQTAEKYNSYRERAIVFGVVPRTVTALVATAFKKEPVFVLPEEMKYLLDDCTGTGVPLISLSMRLLQEIIVTSRAGLLVDRPESGGNPFLVLYDGQDILNWSEDTKEPFVVLENQSLVRNPNDKFEMVEKKGWRELSIDNGSYTVRLWEVDGTGVPYIVEEYQPLRFEETLKFIPFSPISAFGIEYEPSESPILPLAQLSHKAYLISADRQSALHLIAIPTPVVAFDGLDAEEFRELKLGPDTALILPSSTAKWGFLEFAGQGLGAIERAEDDLLKMMGALGARILMGQTASSEKAAGVVSRETIANSVLTSVLTSLEVGLNNALKTIAFWMGIPENEVYCKFNKELLTTNLDANTLNALFSAYQNNSIDLDTLFHNLSEGGYIPVETDKDTFAKNLETQSETENSLQNPLDNQE